ncbi:MAG: hypothetical protein ABFD61_09055 [Chloroherpetonaceae bacterium]
MKMDINIIKRLLEKFYDGETSLEEEAILSDYFNNEDIPEELQKYQAQFAFYQQERNITFDNLDFELPPKMPSKNYNRQRLYWAASIAATILIFVSILFLLPQNPFSKSHSRTITVSNPDSTYAITKNTLYAVSKNLNKGLGKLQKFEYLDYGMNEINKINKNLSNTQINKESMR